MNHPSRSYLRALPPTELVDMVEHLDIVGPRSATWWWHYYNGHRGFYGDLPTFKYALIKAGMVKTSNGLYQKPGFSVTLSSISHNDPGGHP